MSDTSIEIRQKMTTAAELHGVVHTMKAMAAANIGQYEQSVHALEEYCHAVQLGLADSLRALGPLASVIKSTSRRQVVDAIVIGSDQGLVGQFNDVIVDCAIKTLPPLPATSRIWAVGDRVRARLESEGVPIHSVHEVPTDVRAISALVARLQLELDAQSGGDGDRNVYVFHHRAQTHSAYTPIASRLLPLVAKWRDDLIKLPWPTKAQPENLGPGGATLRALIGEHVFIALFRACAESLLSENASRLSAMQRAEKNIDELSEDLTHRFHRLRQRSIDEQLFDVITGFESSINRPSIAPPAR